jgi:hypothetical protein
VADNAVSPTTGDDGVASAVVEADAVGTATIDAVSNLKKGSAELTIEQPTLAVDTNVSSVTVGEETNVMATVTYDNNGTAAEGATVSVSGAGVSVADQTTDAQGNATFSVNASEAGDITVNATMSGTNAGETTITAEAAAVANFSLSNLDAPTEITQNESYNVTVNVTNGGNATGTQNVTYTLGSDVEQTEEVSLDAGNDTMVTFEVSAETTANISAGNYTHTVATDGAENLTQDVEVVEEANTTQPPAVGDFENAPTDTDNDGKYDDVNGDGTFDVNDVTALWVNRDGSNVTDNADAFDFNGDGTFDVNDITKLFALSQ